MHPLLIALLAGVGFVVAYHTYGRWLGGKIFKLSANAICPSRRMADGNDYVETNTGVVFGHHFASIAGTGPIVGPAVAIMWGWLPALLWVIFGSIFIGAVHDLGALVVSLRNNGQTVGDIAGRVLNRRVRLLFLCVLFLALTIVLAIFGLVIATVFRMFPSAIVPCLIQIPIAVGIGAWLNRHGKSLKLASVIALGVMYLTVIYGDVGFLHTLNSAMAEWSLISWVLLLLIYSYVASVLPVWALLQPRDYINALQLISVLGLLVVGVVAASFFGGAGEAGPVFAMAAPAINANPVGAPAMFPFLFITIACGAISGFHCLVSSGTSSKQLKTEPDARFVGYGAMLTEGFLATLVILACAAGVGLGVKGPGGETLVGAAAWTHHYGVWSAGLGPALGAFVGGSANFLQALGISGAVAIALMGVFVASFAATTLDTACRLQRYIVQELANTVAPKAVGGFDALGWLRGKHGATVFAVGTALLMAATPPSGQSWSLAAAGRGGLMLWPIFGATNQLLGGLSFLVIAFYLWRRSVPIWFLVGPMILMLILPAWAMTLQAFVGESSWWAQENWLLVAVAVITMALEVWMVIEAIKLFPRVKGVIETGAVEPVTT
ncbi:carbon starvation CstA family protein [Synoicihabitans lomoniglobus]|uniref:Carbon starvation protein A n=1 Tax=Synoicihabitans lomoniglobus TaxID=2909285 RepID=A0AAF0CNT3_9BACT|nr:carbon starvation protein A [Opitutaceae bacterium LMO-M01]WED65001.1 carbon starvation protein A [Opitutaceae bacterium LMO-M01]